MNNKEAELKKKITESCIALNQIRGSVYFHTEPVFKWQREYVQIAYDSLIDCLCLINTRPEPPAGEWEEDKNIDYKSSKDYFKHNFMGDWENKFDEKFEIVNTATYKPKKDGNWVNLGESIKDFIRKHIKPKPSWGEVEKKFKDTFTMEKCAWFNPTRQEVLNHFKKYFTEGE